MTRLRKLLRRWLSSTDHSNAFELLHTVERMRTILDRERMRCDRGQSMFSLLTFMLSKRCSEQDQAAIAQAIRGRVRVTDDAGLLGPWRIGVLLPETSVDGAWKLAKELCDLLPAGVPRPECDVSAYPSQLGHSRVAGDRGHVNGTQIGHVNGDHNGHVSGERSGRVNGKQKSVTTKPTQPMESLFTRRLPVWKRAIDVIGSSVALVVAAPLLVLVALVIKMTSRGPVLYAQQRDGLGGRKFWIYKFRTMIVNAEAMKLQLRSMSEQDGPAFKLKNDPRVTRIGRLLRRTCIDELPQLWNVLRGDMSIVGPRPMCSKEAQHCTQWERRRLDVTPGLTCTWQVRGGTKVTFVEWMRMDLRYAGARSLWKDLQLMVLTVPSVVKRDGVY